MAVVFPATSAYYKILSTITIGKGIGFYGEGSINYYPTGQGVRIRNENTAGADAILMDSSYPGHGSNLRDFILEGNPLSGHGIRINNHQGSTFDNIYIGRGGSTDARYTYGHGKSGLYLDTLSYYNRFTNVRVYSCQENGCLLFGDDPSGINANTFINCQADGNKMNGFLLDSYCNTNNFYSCIAEGNGLYGLLHGSSTASLGLQNNSFYDFYNEGNGLTGSDGIVINAGLRTKLIGGGYSSGTLWINGGAGARIESPSAATIIIGADASYTMLTNIFYSATLTDGGRYTTVIDSVMNKGIYSSGYGGETRFKVAENGLELGTGNQYSFMPLKWFGMQIFPWDSLSAGSLPMPYPPYNIQRGDRTFTRLASAGAPSEAVCVQRLDTTISTQADGPTTTIVVASTTGMAVNDNISVLLTDGTWANNCIDTVTNPTTLVLKWAGIPTGKHAAVGAEVRTCRWKTGAALAN
jgi:hypothetical protein